MPDITFEEWKKTPPPQFLRLGQHLFNTAPEHIQRFAAGKLELDPFNVESRSHMYIINNFLTFCELAWDEDDEQDIKTAYDLVMAMPNATRR